MTKIGGVQGNYYLTTKRSVYTQHFIKVN